MLLVNPATYLSLSAFKAQANDQDLTTYSDAQLTDILVRASAKVDGILNRSYLPREVTEEFMGNGTNQLMLGVYPIIYVKSAQLIMPGFAPYTIPVGQILIDYKTGSLRTWSPMIFQSFGVAGVFPRNGLPIVITYAYGFGFPIPPPSFSLAQGAYGSLPASAINFAVTTRTQNGESLPTLPQTITPTQGGVSVNITPQAGAFTYRVYASQGASTTNTVVSSAGATTFTPASMSGILASSNLTLGFATANAENVTVLSVTGSTFTITNPAINAHATGEPIVASMSLVAESPATNYGTPVLAVVVPSLLPIATGYAPTADNSAWGIPNQFIEATRMLALSILWEQNNLANRGVQLQVEGDRRLGWRSTEGTSGRGVPLAEQQARDMLGEFAFGGVF